MTASLKNIMKTAWTIAQNGFLRFGGSSRRQYFAAALRQAWALAKAPKPKTLQDVANAANELDCVYNAKVWNDRRVYVNLVGFCSDRAGDRNLKVFFDKKLGWVVDGLKGNMSGSLMASLNDFAAAHGIRRAW